MTTRRIVLVALLAACVLAAGPAMAKQYPNRVIKLIVPFPPRGPIDTMARLVAHELSTKLAQDVVVENRPGAGSTIGSRQPGRACLVRSRFTA
jgi:tripartite-type tricarboxylate transporter receptor subunit TctC